MRKSIFAHPVILLKCFAAIMYVTMGVLIASMPDAFGNMLEGITPILINIFAALLIVYGLFRGYRAVREYREIQQENDTLDAE